MTYIFVTPYNLCVRTMSHVMFDEHCVGMVWITVCFALFEVFALSGPL